jgi:hypothetical protein
MVVNPSIKRKKKSNFLFGLLRIFFFFPRFPDLNKKKYIISRNKKKEIIFKKKKQHKRKTTFFFFEEEDEFFSGWLQRNHVFHATDDVRVRRSVVNGTPDWSGRDCNVCSTSNYQPLQRETIRGLPGSGKKLPRANDTDQESKHEENERRPIE